MKKIFYDSSKVEKSAKEKYKIPQFLMMENAAKEFSTVILKICKENSLDEIIFLCGKGNNGGDGLASARLLQNKINLNVFCPEIPKTEEALWQYQVAKNLGINFIEKNLLEEKLNSNDKILVCDCIFGTGFYGKINDFWKNIIFCVNKSKKFVISCDIPSGLDKDGFIFVDEKNNEYCIKSNVTVSMGVLKLAFYSDEARNFCGKIITAELGISEEIFENCENETAFLIEKNDAKLPWRKNKSVHKGKFGNTVVFSGEKAGASIIAGTAALKFGSGYSSLLKTENSNLQQFKINPELLICDSIPKNATSVLIGSGLGKNSENSILEFLNWFKNSTKPACVLDADIFLYENFFEILCELNEIQDARIILTPHPKELCVICKTCGIGNFTTDEVLKNRIKIARIFTEKFPKSVLIMKSSVTFIASNKKIFVISDGNPSLAKAGSGDVLAGMCAALLSQGYSAENAAISATEIHAVSSKMKNDGIDFDLTPFLLIENLH